jgi:hypothetical protein
VEGSYERGDKVKKTLARGPEKQGNIEAAQNDE